MFVRLLPVLQRFASCILTGVWVLWRPVDMRKAACQLFLLTVPCCEGGYRLGAQKPLCMMQPGQGCAGCSQTCIVVEAAMQHKRFGRVSVAPSW